MREQIEAFFPKTSALHHTKPMLLINNGKSKMCKLYSLFEERMCADQQTQRPLSKILQYGRSLSLWCATRKKSHLYAKGG